MKQLYIDTVIREVWPDDKQMRKHFESHISRVVELSNGVLIGIEKPTIEKRFCFGYSDSPYNTDDYDRAHDMAHHAATSTDYFKAENLKQIDEKIDELNRFNVYTMRQYWGAPENSLIHGLVFLKNWEVIEMQENPRPELHAITAADLEKIIDAYKAERVAFEKRLNSYLKRYGLKKVETWAYWQDA